MVVNYRLLLPFRTKHNNHYRVEFDQERKLYNIFIVCESSICTKRCTEMNQFNHEIAVMSEMRSESKTYIE